MKYTILYTLPSNSPQRVARECCLPLGKSTRVVTYRNDDPKDVKTGDYTITLKKVIYEPTEKRIGSALLNICDNENHTSLSDIYPIAKLESPQP